MTIINTNLTELYIATLALHGKKHSTNVIEFSVVSGENSEPDGKLGCRKDFCRRFLLSQLFPVIAVKSPPSYVLKQTFFGCDVIFVRFLFSRMSWDFSLLRDNCERQFPRRFRQFSRRGEATTRLLLRNWDCARSVSSRFRRRSPCEAIRNGSGRPIKVGNEK